MNNCTPTYGIPRWNGKFIETHNPRRLNYEELGRKRKCEQASNVEVDWVFKELPIKKGQCKMALLENSIKT